MFAAAGDDNTHADVTYTIFAYVEVTVDGTHKIDKCF